MTVSFVTPAFNAADTIAETLESLIAQTQSDWEAIVVDDGSSDRTFEVAAAYADRDPRIRLVRQSNRGESGARNTGIALASSEWLAFLDADDWVSPIYLERLTSALRADPTLDAVHCLSARVTRDRTLVTEEFVPPTGDLFDTLAERVAFPIHACVVKRSIVESVGLFDVSLKTCPDWDLWQRVARTGAHFGGVREVLAFYRMRADSASLDAYQMVKDALEVLRRGHSSDPRVRQPHPDHARGRSQQHLHAQQFYVVCWSAGVLLGKGADARPLLQAVRGHRHPELDPTAVASCIFESAILPRCEPLQAWARFWPTIHEQTAAFLCALQQESAAPGFAERALASLEALIFKHSGETPLSHVPRGPSQPARQGDRNRLPGGRDLGDRAPGSPTWSLRAEPGCAATLVIPQDDPSLVRVAIRSAGTGVAHDIQINQARVRIASGGRYRLTFAARADAVRRIGIGIARARAPWDNLGFYREVELGTRWSACEETFIASSDDDNARIHLDLGGSAVSVEVSAVRLQLCSENEPTGPYADVSPAASEGDEAPEHPGGPPGGSDMANRSALMPLSDDWGWDRGLPVDRYYIEEFLSRHATEIRGRVIEIGDDVYTRKFGGEAVSAIDILDVKSGNPRATVVADLASAPQLASNAFDCIVLPQTLQYIYDLQSAVDTLYRILASGGTVLATLPGISAIRHDDPDVPWYWHFTTASARRLFETRFSRTRLTVEARGNLLTAVSFLQGRAAQELSHEHLTYTDRNYEVVITVRAVKE